MNRGVHGNVVKPLLSTQQRDAESESYTQAFIEPPAHQASVFEWRRTARPTLTELQLVSITLPEQPATLGRSLVFA